MPALVLVHGGSHAADCWDLVIEELRREAPQLRVIAVDLPGRGSNPADLATVTLGSCVDSVIAAIGAHAPGDVVIVGHSLAGLVVPTVAARLGPDRVREIVLVAAFIPPHGSSVVDGMGGVLAPLTRIGMRREGTMIPFSGVVAGLIFWNGLSRTMRRYAMARLYPEALRVLAEPVDLSGFPSALRRTWVMTTRDRALSARRQRAHIAALGGVDEVIEIDGCHDVMYSNPTRLAAILHQRCESAGQCT